MQEAPAPSPPRVRRGRPPRFSREQIVVAAADLLRGDPPTPLTMGRVAAALGASPMSLYRYFADRDDLVMAVTRHVMSLSRVDVPEDATWEVQLAAWMTSVYDQALRHPQLLHISAAGDPAAWLSESAHLVGILEGAGFTSDRRLAEAVYWVATTALGHAMVAAAQPEDAGISKLYGAIGHLSALEAARAVRVIPHIDELGKDPFSRVAGWTIFVVRAMVDADAAHPDLPPESATG
jgi:TetR/AcrR family transcriptional regulator, tetracycline repressor protein